MTIYGNIWMTSGKVCVFLCTRHIQASLNQKQSWQGGSRLSVTISCRGAQEVGWFTSHKHTQKYLHMKSHLPIRHQKCSAIGLSEEEKNALGSRKRPGSFQCVEPVCTCAQPETTISHSHHSSERRVQNVGGALEANEVNDQARKEPLGGQETGQSFCAEEQILLRWTKKADQRAGL